VAEFYTAVLVVNILIAVTCVLPAVLVLRKLRRANRVAPGRRSPAPLSWLVSLGAPARLHRRLRRAVAAADLSVAVSPAAHALQDVAGELAARAISLDDCLVAADSLHPAVRRNHLTQLAAEVREVELSTARLHRLSSDWRLRLDQAAASATPFPDLHERMDSVEAALRELPHPSGTGTLISAAPPAPLATARARLAR
jgi:hypothetical protein